MIAADGGDTAEMAVLRKQFNKYFSLPSGLLWCGLMKLVLQKPSRGIYIRDAFTSLWKSLEARSNCLHRYGHTS